MESEEIAELVEELDSRLERLRVLYDQFFMGIEKIPPAVVHKDVERRIWVLRREKIRNTGTRFRFQQVIQRYNTFGSYWVRILREIENGTYKRDVARARRRFGNADPADQRVTEVVRGTEPPGSIEVELELDVDDALPESFESLDELADLEGALRAFAPEEAGREVVLDRNAAPPLPFRPSSSQRRIAAPIRPATSRGPASPAKADGEAEYRQVYARYVETRRKNGESTAGLTYDSLSRHLQEASEKLKEKSGGKTVAFDVVVKDGKTVLRPTVK